MSAAEKIESTELTLPQRAAVALNSSDTEIELQKLVTAARGITAVTNKAGRDECHAALMALVKARTAITKVGKAARDDANAFCKAVIAEEKRLITLTEAEEVRLQALRDKWDAEREAERQALLRKEQERVDGIKQRIAGIRAVGQLGFNTSSETIKQAIDNLKAVAIDDTYAEFRDEAQQAKSQVMGELVLAHNAAMSREQREQKAREEAERLKAEREALEKQQAELRAQQEEAERKLQAERDEFARQQREERERIDRERAELDRRRAEIEATQNPAPIEFPPEEGETLPVVGDVFPPEIEADESESLGSEDRAMLREWILPFIGRAPACKTEIGREIVRGMCRTAQDELDAIGLM